MSITKKNLKTKPIAKVTFKIGKKIGKNAETAHLVGDFNHWELSDPMKKNKDGSFTITKDLESGKEYQFRYLLDQQNWHNEKQADKQVISPYGDSENSVILT